MAPAKNPMEIPVVPNIHRTLLERVTKEPDTFDMGTWHTECGTTHCRAGHIVLMAGKAGIELEKRTSTLFAAMQIYNASSPIKVSPPRFYEPNEKALADMKRCADQESKLIAA